ncbi:MAG: PAS domain S-box protein [Gemmatimonadetes bacterium]|nr:PAS domain S-box protein [Gemmatimonadota bacterium]
MPPTPRMNKIPDSVLASVVDLATDAIICADQQYLVTVFNEGAVRIFGYQASEMLGQPLSKLLPQRFRARHDHHLRDFASGRVASRRMGDRAEVFGVRKNGEEFPADASISRVESPVGIVFSVVLRDVSEQRRAEGMVRTLLAEAEAAIRARDDMLGLVSHDLRNPVNAVKMLAGAIIRMQRAGEPVPHAVAEHAGVMLQASTQMDALIQDLLDVTLLESGKMRLVAQATNAERAIRTAVGTLAPLAAGSAVKLTVSVDAGVPEFEADPDRLVQLLSNLVGNAVKFSPPGSEVRIEAARVDDEVHFAVKDKGIGISAEELPRAFDRYWQSKRTNRSGAGLGLAIARGIVQAHGGKIRIESTSGRGTTVFFTLPLAASEPPDEG